jgi:hypothetical protein
MYWDSALNVPAANNPWFNQYAKHAYNVGYDFNHESTATQDFVHRVIDFWLTNYKIDGFRWDLAKGFTQKQTCDNTGNNCDVNAWGQYDQSRIDIWKKYYGYMQAASARSYCILEMFADDSEQKVESANGMLLWGNENYNYNQATMGYKDGWDFNYGLYTNHSFAEPNLVTYQESHDEERLMYKNEQYGASNGSYNVKNIPTGLSRNGMAAAFWATQPGPKMLWEFGELGYDLSINRCTDGSVNSNCRLDPKPPHWEYYNDASRKALYDVYADLFHLKLYPDYASTFINGTTAYSLSDTIKWQSISGSNLQVMVLGNFGVKAKTAVVTFPSTGKWYSYLSDGYITVGSLSYTVNLQPGEYYVYTNKDIKGTVLAVNWLSFSAQKNGNHSVLLSWSTESEANNDYFEIERSSDGVHFTRIATVNAVAGTYTKKYSFTDNLPLSGTDYYRIKQLDKDGSYQYSETKKVNMADVAKRWNIYPNPAKNNATLSSLNNYNKAEISVCNLNGKIVYHATLSNVMAGQSINIPVGNLGKGVYVVKIITDKNTDTQKLVVE